MTTFKAYGPQRKINFFQQLVYIMAVFTWTNTTIAGSLELQKMTLTNASWCKLMEEGSDWFNGKTRYGFEVTWLPKIGDMFFFHGTMYIYEKVGNPKPDWFIYDKIK